MGTTCARCASIAEALAAQRPVVGGRRVVKGEGFTPPRTVGWGMGLGAAAKQDSIADRRHSGTRSRRGSGEGGRRGSTRVGVRALVRECGATRAWSGITAAMNSAAGASGRRSPSVFDMGIAEQQAILSRLLALRGVEPIHVMLDVPATRVSTRSCTTCVLQKFDMIFALDRAGLVGDDGPAHHGVRHRLRALPAEHLLIAPRDPAIFVQMLARR